MVDPWKTFARRMREERLRSGVHQSVLAGRISERLDHRVDTSAVSRIEGGGRPVRLDEAVVIADVLEVPLSWLLEGLDAVDERIDELRHELIQARDAVVGYEGELQRARASVATIERAIAEMEAARSTR